MGFGRRSHQGSGGAGGGDEGVKAISKTKCASIYFSSSISTPWRD